MCGQVGIIFGHRRRSTAVLEMLTDSFVHLLLASEERGPHATGMAWLGSDGSHGLYKRPGRAQEIVFRDSFVERLHELGCHPTVLMGHTRWRTRGSEKNNANNHPLRAGNIIGTHNGTIYNASHLFKKLRLPRHAEVDSEILFRMASRSEVDGEIDVGKFLERVALCRGQISAVLASIAQPGTILVLKGNKPLTLRHNAELGCVAYATEARWLDNAFDEDAGWEDIAVDPMTLLEFSTADVCIPTMHPLMFRAQERRLSLTKEGIENGPQ